MPEIINNALVVSLPGRLDLLPALPDAMPRGEISGIRARGQITINHLKWEPGLIEVELILPKQQTIQVSVPSACGLMAFNVTGAATVGKGVGANTGSVSLQPNVPLEIQLQSR